MEVVGKIEPEEHCDSTSNILFSDSCEHSIKISARNDVLLIDVLLQLLPIFFQHLELREESLTFSVQKPCQLAGSGDPHDFITGVEVNEIDEGIACDKALVSEFLLPVEKFLDFIDHELDSLFHRRVHSSPSLVGAHVLLSQDLGALFDVVPSDGSQAVLAV
jgi:hypothetical protein